jgi:molybdenum cofactor cytidylyltransferase
MPAPWAIVPAAGLSTRMGQPKLALPLGPRTVLEQVVKTLRQGGVGRVLVVLGPHVAGLAPLAESGGACVLLLDRPTADMRATLEHGLRWLEDRHSPRPEEAWLLVPADHPAIDPAVVGQILSAGDSQPDRSIIVPTYQGRRGHPVLIRWEHVAGIRALPSGQGLNVYLRQQASCILELPVASESILFDLDTPGDYERLCRDWTA